MKKSKKRYTGNLLEIEKNYLNNKNSLGEKIRKSRLGR
jgi:hypothetical protein